VAVGVDVGVIEGVGVGPTHTEPPDGELSVVSVVVSITIESIFPIALSRNVPVVFGMLTSNTKFCVVLAGTVNE
jgi:hypothetical protein